MAFTPLVLTQIDSNNSGSGTSASAYSGSSTTTIGFSTIVLTIESTNDSAPCGVQIQFSNDNSTWETFYTDTYFASTIFTKIYSIKKAYYKISVTFSSLSNFTTTSRLSTQVENSDESNSVNSFDNNKEQTIDAFGKLRITNPYTLLDLKIPYLPQPVSGTTGTQFFLSNNEQITIGATGTGFTGTVDGSSKLVIQTTDGNTGFYKSQSRNYCVYQPGKSIMMLFSGIIGSSTGPSSTGYARRIGYFDDKNGLFFEYDDTNGISVVLRNDSVDTPITYSNWNIDPMNGNGTSKLNLDFTKDQLFVIDAEWLGAGRIRFGFYAYGKINYCHQIININNLSTGPYTPTMNLPIRYELSSVKTPRSGDPLLTQVCATIISEGGYNPSGRPFCISSGQVSSLSAGTEAILLALRGGSSNYYHQIILPTSGGVISTGQNDFFIFRFRLYRDGITFTSSTTTWINVNSTSVCQYATFSGVSGGGVLSNSTNSIVVNLNYAIGKGINSLDDFGNIFNNQLLNITSNINNVPDVLVLTCEPVTGNNYYGQLAWQEIY
jgi:hypothetical protein